MYPYYYYLMSVYVFIYYLVIMTLFWFFLGHPYGDTALLGHTHFLELNPYFYPLRGNGS